MPKYDIFIDSGISIQAADEKDAIDRAKEIFIDMIRAGEVTYILDPHEEATEEIE